MPIVKNQSSTQEVKHIACSRCLAPGHLVSDCRNQLRCWFCARYGHKRRSCLQWKCGRRIKWAEKAAMLSMETRARQSDGVEAEPTLSPSICHAPAAQHAGNNNSTLGASSIISEASSNAEERYSPANGLDMQVNLPGLNTVTAQMLAQPTQKMQPNSVAEQTQLVNQGAQEVHINQHHRENTVLTPITSFRNSNIVPTVEVTWLSAAIPVLHSSLQCLMNEFKFKINYLNTGPDQAPKLTIDILPRVETTYEMPALFGNDHLLTFQNHATDPSSAAEPMITMHNQIVTKFYTRRPIHLRKRNVQSPQPPIFSTPQTTEVSNTGKRVTPDVSDDKLRRSTRIRLANDGCKTQTGTARCSCCKGAPHHKGKARTKRGQSSFNIPLPNLISDVTFPSLDEIDKSTNFPLYQCWNCRE
jgi:hypothetical protein